MLDRVAEAIARAALLREESRGAHSRLDFPEPYDDDWGERNIVVAPATATAMSRRAAAGRRRRRSSSRSSTERQRARGAARDARRHAFERLARRRERRRASSTTRSRPTRAWSSSTRSTRSSARRRRTSPCAGTARRPSAARAAPRSTASRALMCKTRLDHLPAGRADHRRADERVPDHPRPRHRRLVELRGQQEDPAVHAAARTPTWRWQQEDVDRVQEFRKCIECFLCQDVCHVLRDHELQDRATSGRASSSGSRASRCTRSTTPTAATSSRTTAGIGLCNITKCCTEVCPEGIHITDNAIIPLKERVVDRLYDPLLALARRLRRRRN